MRNINGEGSRFSAWRGCGRAHGFSGSESSGFGRFCAADSNCSRALWGRWILSPVREDGVSGDNVKRVDQGMAGVVMFAVGRQGTVRVGDGDGSRRWW